MEIIVNRFEKRSHSVVSEMLINGIHECYILEDTDRGLDSSMLLSEIKTLKVPGKTAIPTGRYRITISFSNRFQKYLPELHDVTGFAGIRIHSGNTPEDTEGCLLPGLTFQNDCVGNSRVAFEKLMQKLLIAEKKEEIYITIK